MSLDPQKFAHTMAQHLTTKAAGSCWTEPGFSVLWQTICRTLNDAQSHDGMVRVIPACLGSSKTESMKVYASRVSIETGVLIVVELQATADQVAKDINELAGDQRAISYHTKADAYGDEENLWQHPVVVICHASFELAAERELQGQYSKLHYFTRFGQPDGELDGKPWWKPTSRRKLICIDEGPDLLKEARIDDAVAEMLLRQFPEEVSGLTECQLPLKAIGVVAQHLRILREQGKNIGLSQHVGLEEFVGLDMRPLIAWLSKIEPSFAGAPAFGTPERIAWERAAKSALLEIPALVSSWTWFEKRGLRYTLNTCRTILPPELIESGFVILDATAEDDIRYELFGPRLKMVKVPTPRTYQNVRLHVAIVPQGVGKTATASRAYDEAPLFLNQVAKGSSNPSERQVFVLTNLDAEPCFVPQKAAKGERAEALKAAIALFHSVKVGHYGQVAGSNDYRDCDTAAVFGLQYPPREHAINLANAKEVQDPEWWKNPSAIRLAQLRGTISHIFVQLAQGLGRIRSRVVVDHEGNCAKADVFLILQHDAQGICKSVLKKIHAAMPGLRPHVAWSYNEEAQAFFAESPRDEFVYAVVQHTKIGEVTPAINVWNAVGYNESKRRNRAKQMTNPHNELFQTLKSHGITYHAGKGNRYKRTDFFTRDQK
jgi:hypothetical protein